NSMTIVEARAALESRKARIIADAKQHLAPPPEPDIRASREPLPAVEELRALLEETSEANRAPEPEPPPSPKPIKPKPKRPPKGPFKPRIVGGNPDIPLPPK